MMKPSYEAGEKKTSVARAFSVGAEIIARNNPLNDFFFLHFLMIFPGNGWLTFTVCVGRWAGSSFYSLCGKVSFVCSARSEQIGRTSCLDNGGLRTAQHLLPNQQSVKTLIRDGRLWYDASVPVASVPPACHSRGKVQGNIWMRS